MNTWFTLSIIPCIWGGLWEKFVSTQHQAGQNQVNGAINPRSRFTPIRGRPRNEIHKLNHKMRNVISIRENEIPRTRLGNSPSVVKQPPVLQLADVTAYVIVSYHGNPEIFPWNVLKSPQNK